MATSPTKQLATIALGADVVEWIRARRDVPAEPSFRSIATELRLATGIDVHQETIRLWYLDGRPASAEAAS